jgi:hypothetical protein
MIILDWLIWSHLIIYMLRIGWEFFMLLCTFVRLGSTSCLIFRDASMLFTNTILLPLLDWWIVNQESMRKSHPYIVLSMGVGNHLGVVCSVDCSHLTRRWSDFLLSHSQVGEHITRLTCLPPRQMWFTRHYRRHCYHGLAIKSPSLVLCSNFSFTSWLARASTSWTSLYVRLKMLSFIGWPWPNICCMLTRSPSCPSMLPE